MNKSHVAGFTVVEALMASGLLGLLVFAALSMVSLTTSELVKSEWISEEDRVVAGLVEEIRSEPNRFQKNFAPSVVSNADLIANLQLPIAWSPKYRGPPAGCPECTGRMGYVMRTVNGFPGIFMVTVFIENPEMFQGIKEYPFLVTAR